MAWVIVELCVVVVWWMRYSLAQRALSGGSVSDADVAQSDMVFELAGIGQLFVFTTTSILFLLWVRRAYRNLGPLGVRKLRFKAGWAVGAWFVPILGFLRPKEIVNDIWRATDPDAARLQDDPGLGRPVDQVVNMWWGAYLFSWVAFRLIAVMPPPETPQRLVLQAQAGMLADAMGALSGVVAFLAVRTVTKRHDERAAALGVSVQPPDVPPQQTTQ